MSSSPAQVVRLEPNARPGRALRTRTMGAAPAWNSGFTCRHIQGWVKFIYNKWLGLIAPLAVMSLELALLAGPFGTALRGSTLSQIKERRQTRPIAGAEWKLPSAGEHLVYHLEHGRGRLQIDRQDREMLEIAVKLTADRGRRAGAAQGGIQ